MQLKVLCIIAFFVLSSVLVGCSEEKEFISEAEALGIAKEINNGENVEWKIDFNENAEIEPGKVTEAWVVEGIYPAGNKTIYYIDAVTGEPTSVAQIEAP